METDVTIKFTIEIYKNEIQQDNYKYHDVRENYSPYILFGLDGSFKNTNNLQVFVDKKIENNIYEIKGDLYELNKIPSDASLISEIFIMNVEGKVLSIARIAFAFANLKLMSKGQKMKLVYKNERNENEIILFMKIKEIEIKKEFNEDNNLIAITEEKISNIERYVGKMVEKWHKNDYELFGDNYYFDTTDIWVKCAITIGPHRPLNSFINFKDDLESNEEFWVNILEKVAFINLLENKPKKLDDFKDSNLSELIDFFYEDLDINKKVYMLADMFTIVASNLIYNTDNVIHINKNKEITDDFYNVFEGAGDCEDFSNFMLYSQHAFQHTNFKNKTLKKMKKIANCYIFNLTLCGVRCGSISKLCEDGEDSVGSHMCMSMLSKYWLLNGDKNDDNFGRILLNPHQKNEEITKNLNKIYNYELEQGNIQKELPYFVICEGTGFTDPSSKDNENSLKYKSFSRTYKKFSDLKSTIKTRIYHPYGKEKSNFYVYVLVLTTNFFIKHMKYPCDIKSLTCSYNKKANLNKLDDSDERYFIRGCHHTDMIKNDEDIIFIPIPKSKDFKEYMQIVETCSKPNLKPLPLILENNNFKPRHYDKDGKYTPPTPNVPNTFKNKIIEKIRSKGLELKSSYRDKYEILEKGEVIYFTVTTSCMDLFLENVKTLISNGVNVLYIENVELTSVCSYFLVCVETKEKLKSILESEKFTLKK